MPGSRSRAALGLEPGAGASARAGLEKTGIEGVPGDRRPLSESPEIETAGEGARASCWGVRSTGGGLALRLARGWVGLGRSFRSRFKLRAAAASAGPSRASGFAGLGLGLPVGSRELRADSAPADRGRDCDRDLAP